MKQVLKNNLTLQSIIAISSVIIAVLSMLYIGTNVYNRFSEELIMNSRTFSEQVVEQVTLNIEKYLGEGIRIHEEIGDILKEEGEINDNVLTKLNILFSNKVNVVSITAFDENGELVISVPQNEPREEYSVEYVPNYKDLLEDRKFVGISEPKIQKVYKDNYEWVISYGKRIELKQSDKISAYLINVDMNLEPLTRIMLDVNMGESGYVYLKDDRDNIILHPNQAYIFSNRANLKQEDTIYIEKSLSFVDWNLVGVTHLDRIIANNKDILIEIISTIPIVLFIIILITWFISWQISKPIIKLNKTMEEVSTGDFSVRLNMKRGEREVVALSNSFDYMIATVEDLIRQNEIKEKNKRKSELNALQAQINPHFLYNTLDSIMWMAENGSKEEVIEMVNALARLFRISISKGKRMIPVIKELEHVKNYLLIQKVRYKNMFDFEIEYSDEVKDLFSLKLIVQPIVENSIYHGIESLMEKGYIRISAYRKDDFLVYEIEDNGAGMTKERLEEVSSEDRIDKSEKSTGVGINNIRERLILTFGEGYGIKIESEEDIGTKVYIFQPVMEEYDGS